jgi:hypothetical protein
MDRDQIAKEIYKIRMNMIIPKLDEAIADYVIAELKKARVETADFISRGNHGEFEMACEHMKNRCQQIIKENS